MGLILNAKSNGEIVIGGKNDHSKMANLSFETSGHKGFQKELTTEQLEKIEQSHTHTNKETLDGITGKKTAEWDAKVDESTVIKLWQPNTEYKVGDQVFVLNNNIITIYKCFTAHTSSTEFNGNNFDVILYRFANISQVANSDFEGNIIHNTYATKEELSSYSQKPTIITDNTSTTYDVEFLGSTNKIIRLTSALSELNLIFNNGEYNPDLLINLVFTSGETATHIIPQISFPNTGIINWIGTDCALSEGKSIFTPSANTRYDIVFSFDGSQLVGYVCGYTPATVSNG